MHPIVGTASHSLPECVIKIFGFSMKQIKFCSWHATYRHIPTIPNPYINVSSEEAIKVLIQGYKPLHDGRSNMRTANERTNKIRKKKKGKVFIIWINITHNHGYLLEGTSYLKVLL